MLTEQEKRAFVESTIRPMAEHTWPYLTQVVGVIDERTGESRGSGLYCMIGGREAIVTAAHVIDEASQARCFQSLAFTRGPNEPPTIVTGRIIRSTEVDLAVYLPSHPFPVGEEKRFFPEDRIDFRLDKLPVDYLFVQGFPRRYNRFTTLGGPTLVSESLAYGAMMRYRESDIPNEERAQFDRDLPGYPFLPADRLKAHQFALNFRVEHTSFVRSGGTGPRGDERVAEDWSEVFRGNRNDPFGDTLPGQKPRGAHGLSGSPVWRIGIAGRSSEEWSPSLSQLVGIVTDWGEAQGILVATRITSILDVMKLA